MGVPPPPDPGDDCLACWPAGETPEKVYVHFTGIKIGATWVPGLGEPPNQVWTLLQAAPCSWGLVFDPYIFLYRASPFACRILCQIAPFRDPFLSGPLAICTRFATNTIVAPAGVAFYGGQAFVTWV